MVPSKSFEKNVKDQISENDINKLELNSRGNGEQIILGECLLPCSSESFVFLSAS
jgi:hypothetical protein